jgi:succinate dehydrogenase / fumarate reductase flavoprotein subunit
VVLFSSILSAKRFSRSYPIPKEINPMANLESLGKVIETNVLVIGAGVAGLFAAIRAKAFAERVTVVDKGPIGRTSQCYWALGGHQAFLPGDSIDDWVRDVVYFEDGLCEQDVVESVYRETFDRIKDFETFGIEFIKENKQYRRFTTRGLDHVRGIRPDPHGIGGKLQIDALVKESKRLGIQMISRCFITDLLTDDDTVAGAVGFDLRNGDYSIIKADAVVIATGQCSFKGHYACQGYLTGDGMVIAYKAGAELKNMEFATLWIQPATYGWEAIGTSLPMGAQLVNAKGESFVEKYSPSLKSKIDFSFLARAMAIEARKGNGPFFLDHSNVKPEDLAFLKKRAGWMDIHIEKLKKAGVEPFDEKQEWMPVFWTVQGIQAKMDCQTKIPGLFVAGRVRSIDPGVTMGSWSIGSATVLGYRAGENAAKFAGSRRVPTVDERQVTRTRKALYAPLGGVGIPPEAVLLKLQKLLFNSGVLILKHENALETALNQVCLIRDEMVPRMGARDVHELAELKQMENMVLVAEIMLKASLMRTESRATHYREDYPRRDDTNWMKWILVSQDKGEIRLRTEALPLDRYRFKPSRFYSDNFRMPEE